MPFTSTCQPFRPGDAIGDLGQIGLGAPVLAVLDFRKLDAEVAAEPLLERQVGDDVVIPHAQFEGRPLLVPDEPHGQEDKGASLTTSDDGLSNHFRKPIAR
jgi:hypothetical protein